MITTNDELITIKFALGEFSPFIAQSEDDFIEHKYINSPDFNYVKPYVVMQLPPRIFGDKLENYFIVCDEYNKWKSEFGPQLCKSITLVSELQDITNDNFEIYVIVKSNISRRLVGKLYLNSNIYSVVSCEFRKLLETICL